MNKTTSNSREYQRLLYLAFPERLAATKLVAHQWKVANRKKVRAKCRRWYHANRRFMQEKNRRWQKTHPEVCCANAARRRARKRDNQLGPMEPIRKIYTRCRELRDQCCNVVVDHITPLAKGGPHSAGNLQIIYAIENARKGDRLGYQPEVVFA